MPFSTNDLEGVSYTPSYFPQISPTWIRLALLAQGWRAPGLDGPEFRCCQIGFGTGLTLAVHAATHRGEFWGMDYEADHVASARELTNGFADRMRLFHESVVDSAERDDYPDFDLIVVHAVWAWVPAFVRDAIVAFVRKHLKVGGVVQVSYNVPAGWAAAWPVRCLMQAHAHYTGTRQAGPTVAAQAAAEFAQLLAKGGAEFFRANPAAIQHLDSLAGLSPQYLAHEYLASDWQPMSVSHMARAFEPAGVTYACSTNLAQSCDALVLAEGGRRALATVTPTLLREEVRDVIVNQAFRSDLLLRGGRRLAAAERWEALADARFLPVREGGLEFPSLAPILEGLRADLGRARSVAELDMAAGGSLPAGVDTIDAVAVLMGAGCLRPVRPDPPSPVPADARHLNRRICERARHGQALRVVASPVTGCGVELDGTSQVLLLAHWDGAATAGDLAKAAASKAPHLSGASLDAAAREFLARTLPELTALGIA